MKPTEPDITWALENRDLVARWLEQRGGLQDGDCVYTEDAELCNWAEGGKVLVLKQDEEGLFVTHIGTSFGRSTDYTDMIFTEGGTAEEINSKCVWLPNVGDMLEMLRRQGVYPSLSALKSGRWNAWAFLPGSYRHADDAGTPLIALMELLKAVENE